jgi:hypothetical protein
MVKIMIVIALTCIVWLWLYPYVRKWLGIDRSNKGNHESSPQNHPQNNSVVGKSHFYLSQTQTNTSIDSKDEKTKEKADIFAISDGEKNAVISPEKLEESFSDTPELMDINIPLEYEREEETEELAEVFGEETAFATGLSFEDMALAIQAVDNNSDENEYRAGEVFYQMENTEWVEQLASSDSGKASRISALIDLHLAELYKDRNEQAQNDMNESNGEYSNFDITKFIN